MLDTTMPFPGVQRAEALPIGLDATHHVTVSDMGCEHRLTHRPSYIRLRGRWLRAAGFEPGQRVRVRVTGPGSLSVQVVTAPSDKRLDAALAASREN